MNSRRRHSQRRNRDVFNQLPYRELKINFEPLRLLDEDQLEKIHDASMRILETTGLRIDDAKTRQIFKKAGAEVDESQATVKFDRELIMESIATVPEKFTLHGRDKEKRLTIGGNHIVFSSVGGPPFVSDLDRGRRAGTYDDMCQFMKLVQALNVIHMEGGCPVEPTDLPANTRHLDIYLASCKYLDKPWQAQMIGTQRTRDAIEMACIASGITGEQLSRSPQFLTVTNTNTPLVLDEPLAQGIIEMAQAGQAVCVTPFTLSGAMTPVTMASALAIQNAESLVGLTLTQLVNPGVPSCYGAFTSNVDMKSGSPAFGTPEFTQAANVSGQLARRYKVPWRSSNTNASCAVDAQAAYESQMSIWGSVMGHTNFLNHAAGWLEGGLVASFEKLIVDAEMLQMISYYLQPLEVSNETLGLESIDEVGPGGHFFGTEHTMQRFETAFYSPIVSDWQNFENWRDSGSIDTAGRANLLWKKILADYQQPDLDPSIEEELEAYVIKRKEQINKAE